MSNAVFTNSNVYIYYLLLIDLYLLNIKIFIKYKTALSVQHLHEFLQDNEG